MSTCIVSWHNLTSTNQNICRHNLSHLGHKLMNPYVLINFSPLKPENRVIVFTASARNFLAFDYSIRITHRNRKSICSLLLIFQIERCCGLISEKVYPASAQRGFVWLSLKFLLVVVVTSVNKSKISYHSVFIPRRSMWVQKENCEGIAGECV